MQTAFAGKWESLWSLAQRGDAAGLEVQLAWASCTSEAARDAVLESAAQKQIAETSCELVDGELTAAPRTRGEAFQVFVKWGGAGSQGERDNALEIAARNDHADAAAVLLKFKAVPCTNARNRGFCGPLQVAALHNSARAAAVLVAARANIHLQCTTHERQKIVTATTLAAQMGHVSMLAFAAAVGANIDACVGSFLHGRSYRYDCAPLHVAAFYGQVGVLEWLLRAKATTMYAGNADGESALHCAVFARQVPAVAALLAANASVHKCNYAGETPLHLAVECAGGAGIVARLLAAGADVHKPCAARAGASLWTPLMRAACFGNVATVSRLLRARACVNTQNTNGVTACDLAAMGRHVPVIAVLLRAKATINASVPTSRRTQVFLQGLRRGKRTDSGHGPLAWTFGTDL
jgi:ankyrin repeat protein